MPVTAWAAAAACLSGAATLLLTPAMIKAAHAFDWLDYPQADRWHATPTALMGGVAMYGAGALALLFLGPLAGVGMGVGLIGGGATLLFAVGMIDDLWGVGPTTKLAAQVGAAVLLMAAGHGFGPEWPLWASAPVTLVWVIGITNAVNLLDNMDGLAAGIGGIAAVALTALAAAGGALPAALLGGTVGGAALGFLWFNAKPARIFMGDCGSLVLGYGVAALAVMGQGAVAAGPGVAVLAPICALAVPILDTTLVTVGRTQAGRPVTNGGQDHTSHRLVTLGLSESAAVGTLHGMGAVAGGVGLTALVVEPTLFYAACAFGTVALGVIGGSLGRLDVYRAARVGGDGAPSESTSPSSNAQAGQGRWQTVAAYLVGDGLLIGGALAAAHALVGSAGLTGAPDVPIVEGVLLVGAIQLVVLYAMGLYRRLWRHAGTPGIARIVGTILLAQVAAAGGLVLVYGLGAVSAPLLMVDGVILTLGVLGSRLGRRGLQRGASLYRSRAAPAESTSNVLLYGTGEQAMLALRALRDAEEMDRVPVGFVDPDPSKQDQIVQGLPVFGGTGACADLCREHDIDEVIVAVGDAAADREQEVARQCAEVGVACRSFDVQINPLGAGRKNSTRGEPMPGPPA
ncbi:hypothetical protein [Salinibacter ruber]|uniref:UDP-GlcNAc:undecaprenyl-phosphate GlcNAc-1-phosphate transferase n=1 Tax=Salinibacter ruber TaxID=146919 RepID=A0A9X2UNK2_9BACT|nr:hypothetical protein [Salinibacter ruber]MCS3616556.1 UDP-GlcNAc:undecaprenyl-phosphate GlcNAc-1-phosphate transferase [Salinibacter ruber]MCS3675797.1 UDP-GlcNAc:undecaprenyl-phosphate GlcNAc-1-phosphate transferase [Salinibacter ruber]MCS4037852.1 UDP-GlcNAc:undecaprenyl-phosphate GlcNAc-1-phosphate transferase [Salinibacter ruber]